METLSYPTTKGYFGTFFVAPLLSAEKKLNVNKPKLNFVINCTLPFLHAGVEITST